MRWMGSDRRWVLAFAPLAMLVMTLALTTVSLLYVETAHWLIMLLGSLVTFIIYLYARVTWRGEDQLRLIVESLPVPVVYVDSDLICRFCNRHCTTWFSWPGDVSSVPLAQVLGDEFITRHLAAIRTALAGREVSFQWQRPDPTSGTTKFLSTSLFPNVSLTGKTKGFVLLTTDLTQQRQEAELRTHLRDRLNAVGSSAPLILWAVDKNGLITYAEGKLLVSFGLRPSDLVGHHVNQLDPVFEPLALTLNRALIGEEFSEIQKLGARWFETRFTPVRDDQGRQTGVVCVSIDVTEQRETEANLIRAWERLDVAQSAAQIGIFEWDLQGQRIAWNQMHASLYGIRLEDFHGQFKDWAERVHPEDLPETERHLREALENSNQFGDEFRVVHPDGQIRWLLARGQIFRDETGKALRMVGVNIDITERKRIEQEREHLLEREKEAHAIVRAQTERLQTLFRNVPAAVFMLEGPDFVFRLANPFFCQLINHDQEELLGHPAAEVLPRLAHRCQSLFQDAFQAGIPYREREREVLIHSSEGSEEKRFYDVLIQPIYNPDSMQVESLLSFGLDVTEQVTSRHHIEALAENLANQQRWYEQLLDLSPTPCLLVNKESGQVTFVNRAAHRLAGVRLPLGVKPEDHQPFYDLRYPDGRPVPVEDMPVLRAAHGESVENYELVWQTPSGRIPILAGADLIPPMFGHSATIIITFQDLRMQKQAEEKYRKAMRDAESANIAKSRFLANMSHEIRTPLGTILGFNELLEEKDLPDTERRQYQDIIKRSGGELQRLIDDILDLSKVEAGRLDMSQERVSLPELLEDITAVFSIKAKQKGLSLKVTSDGVIPSEITTDPSRLKQILFNIIGNAIKFTEKGGIDISVKSMGDSGRQLGIYVRDTGPGIAPEQVSRLFQPFSQADMSMTRKFGGTGLGLVLSRRLARALGGDVQIVKSDPGVGSTFLITLNAIGVPSAESPPAADAEVLSDEKREPTQPRLVAKTSTAEGLKGVRVLVVDDSPDNQLLLQRLLSRKGARVATAANGRDGVETALHNEFDLVLMDLQMPILDGHRAVQELRNQGYRKPVLAITAHAMKDEREQCLKEGFNGHVTKPVNVSDLIEKVSELTLHH